MSELTNRIDQLLINKKIRRADLVRATGIPDSTIRKWISGSIPSAPAVYTIAQYFGVTVEWLLTGQDYKEIKSDTELSELEKELIEVFRHLDDRDKNAVMTLAQSLESQYCAKDSSKLSSG